MNRWRRQQQQWWRRSSSISDVLRLIDIVGSDRMESFIVHNDAGNYKSIIDCLAWTSTFHMSVSLSSSLVHNKRREIHSQSTSWKKKSKEKKPQKIKDQLIDVYYEKQSGTIIEWGKLSGGRPYPFVSFRIRSISIYTPSNSFLLFSHVRARLFFSLSLSSIGFIIGLWIVALYI